MGVKDLWQVLAPVCERKSLWDLQGKTVAIDLSGWVVDSQNIVEHSSQPNMHLRNLFFRTSCLLLLGARPVFVLEGDAPDLKLNVMSQRNAARGYSNNAKASGKRSRYKGIQKKCQEMLKAMGVHCIQSEGEAEALCATLNANGLVDGCISQDSDCFLYGARVVYRNFTISASSGGGGAAGFSIDMYRMEQIEDLLGLSRTKLIGLSLLCGCDYNQGVTGVGKETAVKFLATLSDSEVFSRFYKWKNDPIYEQLEQELSLGICDRCDHVGKKKVHEKNGCNHCGTTKSCYLKTDLDANKNLEKKRMLKNELNIRKKALQDNNFPSQEVIDEFLTSMEIPRQLPADWCQPNFISFMKLAEKHMNWDECYSLEKFLPLLTRWLLIQKRNTDKCPIFPEAIIKTRVLKGVASYEVRWGDREGLFDTLVSEEGSDVCLTIEPRNLVDHAFPDLVKEFNDREAAKKALKSKGKSKAARNNKAKGTSTKSLCSECGKELPGKNQRCICYFVTTSSHKKEDQSPPSTLEDLIDKLSLKSESDAKNKKKEEEKENKEQLRPRSKVDESTEKLKGLLGYNDSQSPEETYSFYRKEDHRHASGCVSSTSARAKTSDKLSYENLLDDDWSISDFAKEEEGDLSDIVQAITGVRNHAIGTKESTPTQHYVDSDNISSAQQDSMCSVESPLPSNLGEDDPFDELPYTPLIERVRKMQKNKTEVKRTSAAASLKLRRFSESFDAFCEGENATSSPISNSILKKDESSLSESRTLSHVTFSLGISKLLENSK
ncbi:Flap endonuclease GEN [Frankliniella fusca]|uniref:Flap endonuclease GEN n=1 Tax=Frankliniella fusca TaxID=407009 RepID=A0AAE1H4T9_9NEOP|nr:Flap endonuclease GEN [Frankliniella fusca]